MNKYTYNGPVLVFNNCVVNRWSGETWADSEKKAKSNLAYQYKKKNRLVPSAKVTLPGDVEMVG